ncbi:MAG: DUF3037 domain-containing protein [Thermomicrobiales bacterium]
MSSAESSRTLPYLYSILRVVPRVEREEFINAGVVVFSRPGRFLGVRTHLDAAKLHALSPSCDAALVETYLAGIEAVAAGEKDAGPIAGLDLSERFHWIAAPSNTIIQPSPVHPGLTTDPAATLDRLYATLVLDPS